MKLFIALFACALALSVFAASVSADRTEVAVPSWKCISGVCLGMSRKAIEYRFAGYAERFSGRSYFTVRVPGGHIGLTFVKEVDWEALDNATKVPYVTMLSTSDPIFRLPDGVQKGTRIPFGKTWNGYTLRYGGAPAGPLWQKFVRVRGERVRVRLHMLRAYVTAIDLARTTHYGP